MENKKIRIQGIEIAHGEIIRDNEFYEEYFQKVFKQEKEKTRKFFEQVVGRDKRYISEIKTGLELSFEAIDKVLSKEKLVGEDIDVIIYSANIAEYVCPPTSLLVHEHIKGKASAITFDLNANCAGMGVAFNMASSYLIAHEECKRALVVGYDNLEGITGEDNLASYGQFGDVACALVIEKSVGESEILDSSSLTWSRQCKSAIFPPKGFFRTLRSEDVSIKDLKMINVPYEENIFVPMAIEQISNILDKNGCDIKQIQAICFSQYCLSNNNAVEEAIGFDKSKSIFVANKYGYTGTNSPFLALYEGIISNKIKRGDLIIIWAVGAGAQSTCNLLRY